MTDANIVLGRLSATHLLDGDMRLSPALAQRAIAGLARELGLEPLQAARGVVSVVQANMLAAIRLVSVRKGYDPRGATMVAFGGAGPLHAAALARDLGVARVLVPPAPGILCALGLLVEPLRLDLVRTRVEPLDALGLKELERVFAALEQEAHAWLERERVPAERRRLARALDMRYVGQNFELLVEIPGEFWRGDRDALRRAFLREHARVYGHSADDDAIQGVSYRLTALGEPAALTVPSLPPAPSASPDAARAGERPVYFHEAGGFVATPVYRRERLLAGHRLDGPAIVEQMDSTAVILPGQRATIDAHANIIIEA